MATLRLDWFARMKLLLFFGFFMYCVFSAEILSREQVEEKLKNPNAFANVDERPKKALTKCIHCSAIAVSNKF